MASNKRLLMIHSPTTPTGADAEGIPIPTPTPTPTVDYLIH
ncbi:unnamed protein product [Rhodiola kirilowii]